MLADLARTIATLLPNPGDGLSLASDAIRHHATTLERHAAAIEASTEAIRQQTLAQVMIAAQASSLAAGGHLEAAWRCLDAEDCQGAKDQLDKAYALDPSLPLYWLGYVVLAQLVKERGTKARCRNVSIPFPLDDLIETTAGFLRRVPSSVPRGVWTTRLLAAAIALQQSTHVPDVAGDLVACVNGEFFPAPGKEVEALEALQRLLEIALPARPAIVVQASFFQGLDTRLVEGVRRRVDLAQPLENLPEEAFASLLAERNRLARQMGERVIDEAQVHSGIEGVAKLRSRISALLAERAEAREVLSRSRGNGCTVSFVGALFGFFGALDTDGLPRSTSDTFAAILGSILIFGTAGYVVGRVYAWATRDRNPYPDGLSDRLVKLEQDYASAVKRLQLLGQTIEGIIAPPAGTLARQ